MVHQKTTKGAQQAATKKNKKMKRHVFLKCLCFCGLNKIISEKKLMWWYYYSQEKMECVVWYAPHLKYISEEKRK